MNYVEVILTNTIIIGCFGLTLWVLKSWMSSILETIKGFGVKHEALVEKVNRQAVDNEKNFSTWEQHNKLADRVGCIDERVTRLESKAVTN